MDEAVATLQSFLNRSADERRARLVAHEARLRAALPLLTDRLYRLGAARVWLFGSLAWGGLHERSDLDLAVIGLPAGRFFEAYAALLAETDVPVDLVDLDTAPPALREQVLTRGLELPRPPSTP